jgi:hypothetical protein
MLAKHCYPLPLTPLAAGTPPEPMPSPHPLPHPCSRVHLGSRSQHSTIQMQGGLPVASGCCERRQAACDAGVGAGHRPKRGSGRAIGLARARRPFATRVGDAAFCAACVKSTICRGTVRATRTTPGRDQGGVRCVLGMIRTLMCRMLDGSVVQADAEHASIAPRDRSVRRGGKKVVRSARARLLQKVFYDRHLTDKYLIYPSKVGPA